MKRGITRLLSFAAGPLCVLALAAPAGAASGPSAGPIKPTRPAWDTWTAPATHKLPPSALAGFFNSNGGTGSSYNSSGGSVVWSSSGVGLNHLVFTGLGGITGGNVEVSSESEDTCTVDGWGPSSGNLTVDVYCYSYAGVLQNADFSVTVTQPTSPPHGALAYDWIASKAKSYSLSGQYQYNSANHANSVTHLGIGQYKINMPGVGTLGTSGTVKVSAYNSGAGDCQLKSWGGTSTGEAIFVNCYSATGTPQNRQFVVSYARGNNVMGQDSLTDANALADQPASSAYIPHTQFDSHAGATVSMSQFEEPHVWLVIFAAVGGHPSNTNGGAGNVQVTPQNGSYTHCFMFESSSGFSPEAAVACLNNSGHIVSSKYTVQWAVS